MANQLTGDYEAVLQVAIRQINGVLGTLHQNGAQRDNPMTLAHSDTGRIGDPPRRPPGGVPSGGLFAEWVINYQRGGGRRGLRDIQSHLIGTTPPGAARLLTEAFSALHANWANVNALPPPDLARGLFKLQLASVTLAVVEGASSEVTASAAIRARVLSRSRRRGFAQAHPRQRACGVQGPQGQHASGTEARDFAIHRRCEDLIHSSAGKRTERRRPERAVGRGPKGSAREHDAGAVGSAA